MNVVIRGIEPTGLSDAVYELLVNRKTESDLRITPTLQEKGVTGLDLEFALEATPLIFEGMTLSDDARVDYALGWIAGTRSLDADVERLIVRGLKTTQVATALKRSVTSISASKIRILERRKRDGHRSD